MIIDTHAHYDDHAFDADREEMLLKKLPEAGIGRVVDIAAAFPSLEETIRLAEKYDYIYASLGLHPSDMRDLTDAVCAEENSGSSDSNEEAEKESSELKENDIASLMTETQYAFWLSFLNLPESERRKPEVILGNSAEERADGLWFYDYLFTGREREIFDHTLGILLAGASHPKVVAIGEIGLDYHWHQDNPAQQKAWFAAQVLAAKEAGLPLVIHSRDAAQDTFELLQGMKRDIFQASDTVGVMHCYSYKWEMALDYVKMGFLIGIGGSSTYGRAKHKKGKLYQVIREVPLESIVLETDAPYQTPESHRGERNDSSLLYEVAEYIAEIKGCTTEEVVAVTRDNAARLYSKMK